MTHRSTNVLTTIAALIALLSLGLTIPAAAEDLPILGKSLMIKDPSSADKRKVVIKAKQKLPGFQIVGDPTLNGATLLVDAFGDSTNSQTYSLPAGISAATGKPFWSGDVNKGFKYKDRAGENGPVKIARIKKSGSGTFLIRAVLQGKHGGLSLQPPADGTSGCALLAIGNGNSYSVLFADGKIQNNGSKLFKVNNPLTAGTCISACEDAASTALGDCFATVSSQTQQCYASTGNPCSPLAPALVAARAQLSTSVTTACDDAAVQSLGYGSGLTTAGLVDRLVEQCEGNAASLAARTYGGPHAKILAGVSGGQDPAAESCLHSAYSQNATFIAAALDVSSACAVGADCGTTDADIAAAQAQAEADTTTACATEDALESLIGLLPDGASARARRQANCMAAAAIGDASALDLDCGPRSAITVPERGVATQIILDNDEWGTRCGLGEPYAFWIRLAPEGNPLENVVVHLQGGGVCLSNDDCANTAISNPGRFTATDKIFPEPNESAGYQNFNEPLNPFKDWTMVYLPYCTQDIFAGGGSLEVFPDISVERYGAIDMRQTLRYARDILWAAMEGSADGYRPDRLKVLLGGTSAGGFGVQNNSLHFVLDDLRWSNTTTAPNGSLVLDGGTLPLPLLFVLKQPPTVWNLRPYFANYCLDPSCLLGENLFPAHAERLGATPHQQLLHLSGQWDNVQVNTTFFASPEDWINSGRETYCALESTPFNHYFYPANNSPLHNMTPSDTQFLTLTSDGITVADWLANAMSDPASVTDAVQEGTLASVLPGVAPFTCTVSP